MNYNIILSSKPKTKKILFIAIFLFINFGFFNVVNAQIIPNIPHIPPASFAGIIEGEGAHFEITDSAYLDITLDSSESIKLRMESIPEMITMFVEKASSTIASQTQITISGFLPLTTYYKFEDNYHNLTTFTADINGKYAYNQDLTKQHFVFIQPRKSTKFIRDDATGGDCSSIGVWDWLTKTCTLTTNIDESIQIDDNGITLDGNNHTITGTNTGMGVWLDGKADVLIKNLTITSFGNGVGVWVSSKNTFIDNVISNNASDGIILLLASENKLMENKISNNKSAGVSILYSNNNEITDNIIEENEFYGIDIVYSNNNTVENNAITATRSQIGGAGLYIREAVNNNIINNTISRNKNQGVYLLWADNNVLTGNTISHNLRYGFYIIFSKYNKVYRNNIIDNFWPIVFWPLSPSENKFHLPLPIGGNYWSTFDSPAEGCLDANADRICDSPYYFGYGDQDDFPWTIQDGWKISVNQPPAFSNLGQFKSDKAMPIPESGITTESSLDDPKTGVAAFKVTANDPDNDQVKLQIELKEFNQPFNGQDLLESDFMISGSEIVVTRTALLEQQYHWRARAVDNQGNKSDWQEFGTLGNVDFEVKLVPLYTQIESPYPSDEETKSWFNKPYANGVASATCGVSIADCGCAITSEVMIMRFYGITTTTNGENVDPKKFNEWSTNNDGYYSNGDVKWPKINDYTKDQFGIPRLVYSGPISSEDKNILNGQLYNLQPIILNTKVLNRQGKLVDHFIVADGKLSTTYTVKDPIYYLTRNLNQFRSSYIYNYNNHFVGLRLFSPVAVLPDSISAHFASPGEFLFTDPLGRRLGKDPISNIEYNEIPNGVYYQESIGNPESDMTPEASKNIWIPEPIAGQYDIQVIGTEIGSYTLSILTYDQTGNSKDITQTGNILPDIIQQFELNYSTTSAEQTELQRIVSIDIKPGSDPNSINCKNPKEVISVAILTTPIFDAATVDADTVRFSPNNAQEIHKDKNNKAKRHIEDVDKDGDSDLVFHFKFADTGIQCGDTSATLTGKTIDGADIIGSDSIRTIQNNKQSVITKLLVVVYDALSSIFSKIL